MTIDIGGVSDRSWRRPLIGEARVWKVKCVRNLRSFGYEVGAQIEALRGSERGLKGVRSPQFSSLLARDRYGQAASPIVPLVVSSDSLSPSLKALPVFLVIARFVWAETLLVSMGCAGQDHAAW